MEKSSSSRQEVNDKCQRQIWKIRRELDGYSFLFKNLNLTESEGEPFYGTGLAFERMSKKLEKINGRLNKIF